MRPAALAILALSACAAPMEVGFEEPDGGREDPGNRMLDDVVTSSCTTSPVDGLARQIAELVSCAAPEPFVDVSTIPGISLNGYVGQPLLDADAARDLEAVVREVGSLRINSAFRTAAEQYVLYGWYRAGRCRIPIAAEPGRSNHESARAVDVSDWSSLLTPMRAHGWTHDVPGDPVHFDHVASPDISDLDVLAFQQLWNLNHPEDLLSEDGLYGRATAQRLGRSPARGFPVTGAACPPR